MSKTYHVVLSGGVGSRLWPLSRQDKPKQYLPLLEGDSLLYKTVKRNIELTDDLMIVCNQKHQLLCEEILGQQHHAHYIIESVPRNTAAAVAFAALSVSPEDILLVTPADHSIDGDNLYKESIASGIALAQQNYLVTFGIKPSKPETGFGYIEHRQNEVLQFIEKPSLAKAVGYLEDGHFLWNSGIFCFKAKILLEELSKHAPNLYLAVVNTYQHSQKGVMPLEQSQNIPAESLDVAVMEKSDKIKVVPCKFQWTDLGSFESLYDYLKSQGHPIDDYGNMAINASKHTSFIGLENCICVTTKDATLILQKEKSQEVKKLYNTLSKTNPELT